jgi:2-keto-4-pentenoate hydratase
MAVDAREIAALAERIAEGRRSRKPMDIVAATAGLSEADAYEVQFAVHDLYAAAGDKFAGWKIALTLPTQYEPLKLSGPVFAASITAACGRAGPAFEKGWPLKPGIEPELVARISRTRRPAARPIPPTASAPMSARSIAAWSWSNRYVDVTKMTGPARIADNVLQAALVVGTEIEDWQKLDFANLKGRSTLDGKELAAGSSSAVMGGAMISLAWLANALNKHGRHLKAGDLVLTGSVHPPAFLPGTGVAKTEFEGLGSTEITIK